MQGVEFGSRRVKATAWREGADWVAEEVNGRKFQFAPGDNPYEETR
jgi:hypothetical protein